MAEVISLDEKRGAGCLSAGVYYVFEFSGGWAAQLGRKPHWFSVDTIDVEYVNLRSLCGREYVARYDAYIAEPGNYPKCKRCMRKLVDDG